MDSKPFFPMFMDISQKHIVVAGGGTVALRRTEVLMQFCEHITVIAPQIREEFRQLEAIRLVPREIRREDLDGADMICILTDDETVNEQLYQWSRHAKILVNHGTDQRKSDFFFPGIARWDEVTVGVTASGKNHQKAKAMTEYIRKCLEQYEG